MNPEFGPPWHIESSAERTTAITAVTISATGGPICIAAAHAAPLIVAAVNSHEALVAAAAAYLQVSTYPEWASNECRICGSYSEHTPTCAYKMAHEQLAAALAKAKEMPQ